VGFCSLHATLQSFEVHEVVVQVVGITAWF